VNTWGASWGACWGDTWGADAVPPGVHTGGGWGRRDAIRRRDEEDMEVLLYIVAAAVASGVIH